MSETSAPLVSIITPVYNGEEFLVECIESVLAQTYQNWEYIIVNNHSKDRSLEIAEEYARRDPRVRVVTGKEFYKRGVDSWNNAMRQMSPEAKYCKVVHADDWLFPECVEKMVRVAEEYPAAGMVSSYRLCNRTLDCDGLPYPSPISPGREICRYYLLGYLFVFGSPTTLLLRSDLVRARGDFYRLFTGTGMNEYLTDMEACCWVLQQSDLGFVHEVLSFTRIHGTSVTSALTEAGAVNIPELLHLLRLYGPVYLTEREREIRFLELLRQYRKGIALELVNGERDRVNRELKQLQSLGAPVSRVHLLGIAGVVAAKSLLRPAVQALRFLAGRRVQTKTAAPVLAVTTKSKATPNAAVSSPGR